MKNLNFRNFNYSLIDSAKAGYKEVLVTYNVDDKAARQYIFIREMKGKDRIYYLNEAKKQIDSWMSNGKLAKSTIRQLKRVNSKGILKPVLISLGIILGIGAGVGTGFAVNNAINGGGGGQGGGGGGSYQPGDPAPVNFDEESLPKGIKLDIANATVGSDYSTDINLREVAASNGVEYSMPKKLDKVTYKKDTLDVEISDYTYTWVSKTTAKLEIKKDYVLGPISIKLTLQQAEVEDVTLTLAQATTNCKITYNGTQFDAEHPITIRSGKNIDLVCETLDTNYSITNDSFEFTPALPSETGWTWESKARTLHIYNLVVGEGKFYALTVSPIKDPIEILVTRYDKGSYGSGLHLFYGDDEIPNNLRTETPILINGDKCAFRVELDKGYTITDEGFTIYAGVKDLPPDNYSYAEGMLTIEGVPFDEILALRIETNVNYTTNYRSTIISSAEHCKVMYRGNTYGFGDEISVYPDKGNLVQFDIITDDGYVMCCYDTVISDFFGYNYLDIDEFYQTADNHYSVVVSYSETSSLDVLYALFRTSKLPDTYILLDKDSVGRGAFYDESIDRSLPFYDLEKNGYIGCSEITHVDFFLWDYEDDTEYSIASVDGLMPDEMSYEYYNYNYSSISIHFYNHYYIEKGDHITIRLIEPVVDGDPVLSLDSDASDHIIFTDSFGEDEYTETTLIPNEEGYCNFYFTFNNSGSDINRHCLYINGFPYDIDFVDKGDYYRGSFYVGTYWPGYNLELHVNAPVEISLGEINDNKCTLEDPSTGDKLSSRGKPIGYAPNRDGDIVFDCYVEEKVADTYLLTKNSFTIAGDVGDHEYDINSGYLIVHNVTGNFSISIEPGSRYVEILTSTDAPADLINITYYVGKEETSITNKETTISYDARYILSEELYFEIKLTDVAQGNYVIDTECYIDYTTKDSKEEKRLYGLYSISEGCIMFNPGDISNIASMKIHVNYKPIEFKGSSGVVLVWDQKARKINRVNICGADVKAPGPVPSQYVSTSTLDIYVNANSKPSVDPGTSSLTAYVEDIGNRNGIFNYRITISGITATIKAQISIN